MTGFIAFLITFITVTVIGEVVISILDPNHHDW